MRVTTLFLATTLFSFFPLGQAEDAKKSTKLPQIFEEDFEKGQNRWEVTDSKTSTHRKVDANQQ